MMKAEQEVSEEVKDEKFYKKSELPDDVESKPMVENEMVENEILIHEAEDEDEEKEEPSIARPYEGGSKCEEGISHRALKSAIIFLAGRILSGPDMEDFKKLFPKLFV
jgi:hypothetical protein